MSPHPNDSDSHVMDVMNGERGVEVQRERVIMHGDGDSLVMMHGVSKGVPSGTESQSSLSG